MRLYDVNICFVLDNLSHILLVCEVRFHSFFQFTVTAHIVSESTSVEAKITILDDDG